jgi:Tol biopolymer transport system component
LISQRNATVIPQTGDNFSWSQLSVSSNGQWVAFASVADDLLPNDTNQLSDVFVRDLLTGATTLVSAGADGGPAWDGHSMNPVISADGRYVVFLSTATNLAAAQGTTFYINVFRRDLQTGNTILVSTTNGIDAANGDCSNPVISQDGRYVAFLSSARNLLPGNYSPFVGPWTIWRDIDSGTTVVLPTNYTSYYSFFPPSMSGDGRYVAYSYYYRLTSQLRVWDSLLGMDIYATNNSTGSLSHPVLMSVNGARVLYDAFGTFVDDVLTGTNICSFKYPIMKWSSAGWSADGRYFTFVAQTNTASGTNVYLCDIQTGAMTVVSSNYASIVNNGDNDADLPVISSDGRFVVYRSYATGIVPGDTSPAPNIYRYDRYIGTNSILTAGQTGLSPVLWDSGPVISSDGRTVAFLSLGSGLFSPDLNRGPDAFTYATDIGVPLDTDGDGIPDSWMIQYFGHPTGLASDNTLAQDSFSDDGISNLQKYLSGMNPLIWDNLHFISSQYLTNQSCQLTLFGQVGHNYSLLASTNLVTWTPILNFGCTNATNIIYDPDASQYAARFYRLMTPPVVPAFSLNIAPGKQPDTNGLGLVLSATTGLNYRIDASTDLVNWMTVTNFFSTNLTISIQDTGATNYNQRFYRAVLP